MKRLSFFVFLFLFSLAHAENVVDGNTVAEPELKDYQAANRVPGILVEPYDIVDQNNQPVRY